MEAHDLIEDPPQSPAPAHKSSKYAAGELLIAVDGGGTRTRSAVFDRSGTILAEAEVGPSNHLVINRKRALESLAESILNVLKVCGASQKQVGTVSVGLAGVDIGGEGLLEAREWLHHLGFENCTINADIMTAHTGALGGKPGVLALSGTGAAFLGISEGGYPHRVGGWGPAYGDEGSAYWIGQMALRAAAAAYDGRSPGTLLVDSICDVLALRNFSETLQCIYRSKMQVRLIAELSRATECVAQAGDLIAHQILNQAGVELAKGVIAVVGALGCSGPECHVSWEGAVLRNSTIVRNSLLDVLARELPQATLAPPLSDPIYGAYLIGRKTLNWEAKLS